MSTRHLDRREFTLESALAILGTAVIVVSGAACGSDSDPAPTGPSNPPAGGGNDSDRAAAISANHGHRAVITSAQLMAGGAIILDIQGTATHGHTVQLSATEVMAIGDSQRVSTTSTSDDGHAHTVTFN